MREQLTQYVNLLFIGARDCDEIRQEILQNTLDRYDDLIAEGKVPEAAYRMAISGIGNINEILGTAQPEAAPVRSPAPAMEDPEAEEKRKRNRAWAIGLYILAAIPLILLSEFGLDILGLTLTLILAAVATIILIRNGSSEPDEDESKESEKKETPLQKSISALVWSVGLVIYFLLSFSTGAWHMTWLMFPILGAVNGIIDAIFDLKEAKKQ